MPRRARLLITGVVLAALLYPVVVDRDSHPLSTYPMYAQTRSEQSTVVTAFGVTDGGDRRRLTPTLIGESDDPLVVVGQLRADVAAGRAEPRCDSIAGRVADRPDRGDITTVEVVTERHDTVARVRGESSLVDRTVHATCTVPGEAVSADEGAASEEGDATEEDDA